QPLRPGQDPRPPAGGGARIHPAAGAAHPGRAPGPPRGAKEGDGRGPDLLGAVRGAGRRAVRTLGATELEDIARGAAVLGTGGGGDPYLGTLAALRSLEQYGPPRVVDVDELDAEAVVALPFLVGSPVPFIEKFPLGQ